VLEELIAHPKERHKARVNVLKTLLMGLLMRLYLVDTSLAYILTARVKGHLKHKRLTQHRGEVEVRALKAVHIGVKLKVSLPMNIIAAAERLVTFRHSHEIFT